MINTQSTSTILMIRPVHFAFNEQTAASNAFMDQLTKNQHVHHKALREFDDFVEKLEKNGVEVIVVEDLPEPHTPDSIFPNNWISTHSDGSVFLYPMEAKNRRLERRPEIIDIIKERFTISNIIDLTDYENDRKFLEGTGSMVLDRENKIVYACLSSRTNTEVLEDFCNRTKYRAVTFNAIDNAGMRIYHTNVMMCVGKQFAVICMESIPDLKERLVITKLLEETGKEIIDIDFEQLQHFGGNIIQLKNKEGKNLIVMSQQAFKAFTSDQISQIEQYGKSLFSPLYTIENTGGGSARCMIAEIFLPKTNAF